MSDLVSCGAFESALTLSGRVGKEALRLTRLTLGLALRAAIPSLVAKACCSDGLIFGCTACGAATVGDSIVGASSPAAVNSCFHSFRSADVLTWRPSPI